MIFNRKAYFPRFLIKPSAERGGNIFNGKGNGAANAVLTLIPSSQLQLIS